jgi:beta-N-acetylhexosaminidase
MKTIITKMVLVMTAILLFNGCAKDNDHTAGQDGNMKNMSPLSTDPIQEQLNKMTLNEKIGQMIIAGFDGTTVDISARDLINKYKLCGLIVYQPNVKDAAQLASLTNWIKIVNTRNKIPLFISVDQEGGRVNRMPSSIINTPSERTIGNTNSEKYAYNIGNIILKP